MSKTLYSDIASVNRAVHVQKLKKNASKICKNMGLVSQLYTGMATSLDNKMTS